MTFGLLLPFRLSKRQSLSPTVLFRTSLTRTITLDKLLTLVCSNHLPCYFCYYIASQVCCGSKVFSNANICCGRIGYNSATHLCCGGIVHPKKLKGPLVKSACCGASVYNPVIEECCRARYTRPIGCCHGYSRRYDRKKLHGILPCKEL